MRGACKRAESECRFAHPKECVTTDDGLVTVCMDAVKGRCTRAPCRYFHPPLHLQAQIKAAQSRANNIAVMANLQNTNKTKIHSKITTILFKFFKFNSLFYITHY